MNKGFLSRIQKKYDSNKKLNQTNQQEKDSGLNRKMGKVYQQEIYRVIN